MCSTEVFLPEFYLFVKVQDCDVVLVADAVVLWVDKHFVDVAVDVGKRLRGGEAVVVAKTEQKVRGIKSDRLKWLENVCMLQS
jgi:hypothetical protein